MHVCTKGYCLLPLPQAIWRKASANNLLHCSQYGSIRLHGCLEASPALPLQTAWELLACIFSSELPLAHRWHTLIHRRLTNSVLDCFKVLDHLREATPQLEEISLLEDALKQLDELFLLVVVGEFNSGKSTVINALLGDRWVLPLLLCGGWGSGSTSD